MSACQSSGVVGLVCQQGSEAAPMDIMPFPGAKQSPFGHPAQQAAYAPAASKPSESVPAIIRESSCSLPETPQLGKPLPAIRTRTCDSEMSVSTPTAAPEQQQQPSEAPQPVAGWFFNCRGCGCMTAYEQTFAGVEVPFCRRCQVMLIEAKPAMQVKMVDTLLFVHNAWSKAGL